MTFPGDTHVIVLPISLASGANPNVTSVPRITVVNAITQEVVLPSTPMTLISGSQKTYVYAWDTSGTPEGSYLAVVSYAADNIIVNGRAVEKIVLGNSRVTGRVALDATVAKQDSVAKDATVLKFTEYQPPHTSAIIQAIKSAVDRIPNNPATAESIASLAAVVGDLHDCSFGTWEINRNTGQFTMKRKDGTVLQTFHIERTDTQDNRLRS